MARVKRAVNAQKKRRVVLERASGYRGQRSRLYRKAKEQVTHSLVYSYNDRRKNKGNFRKLWIQRINAAARAQGMTYNRFIQGLNLAGVEVDRKILADLAVNDVAAFNALVETAKAALPEDVNAPKAVGLGLSVTLTGAPDRGQRPRQGGTEAQPPLGTLRAAALPCRRPEGRRGRARRSPGCVVEVFATAGRHRAVRRPRRGRRRRVDAGRRPRARLAQRQRHPGRRGRRLPLPRPPARATSLGRRARALVAICADVRDPGNAGTVIRMRRRRRRRRAWCWPAARSTPTTPRPSGPASAASSTCRSRSSRDPAAAVARRPGRRAAGARRRRRRRGRPRRRRRAARAADRLAVRQRGLGPARRAGRARRPPGPDPDPRPRREPQPLHRRRALPLRLRPRAQRG